MKKKIQTGIKSLLIIVCAIVLCCLMGNRRVTRFILKKILFTPYNVVGMIMTIVSLSGGSLSKKQGHWLKFALTCLGWGITICSYTCLVCSWFNINLIDFIFQRGLKPVMLKVGKFLLWLIIVIVGIIALGFLMYGLINLIIYLKEKKNLKHNKVNHSIQRSIGVGSIRKNIFQATQVNNNINNKKIVENKELETKTCNLKQVKENNHEIELKIVEDDLEEKVSKNICPECGWYLKKRINYGTGESFRGCSNFAYHDCTFTISEREYIRIYKKYH